MSKASEYARLLAAADVGRIDDLIIDGGLQIGVTFNGALRLRDWITENFDDDRHILGDDPRDKPVNYVHCSMPGCSVFGPVGSHDVKAHMATFGEQCKPWRPCDHNGVLIDE